MNRVNTRLRLHLVHSRAAPHRPNLSNTFFLQAFPRPSTTRAKPRFQRRLLLSVAIAIPAFALSDPSSLKERLPSSSPFSFWPPTSTGPTSAEDDPIPYSPFSHPAPTGFHMVTPATFAPGRPETLTKEQEAKLKELWTASLQVFGAADDLVPAVTVGSAAAVDGASDSVTPVASEPPSEDASTTSEAAKKKKKSLGGLLGRKPTKKDADAESIASSVSAVPTTGSAADTAPNVTIDHADDKYGHGKEFRAALASQTPAELRAAFWSMVKCDNPDGLLLRFLRARKWDVDKALVMMVATMKWRAKEMDVAAVVKRGEIGAMAEKDEGFLKQLTLGKSFLHGVDKEGRPICYIRVRLHRATDQDEASLEKFTIYTMETARLMLRKPVDTACVVFDMTDFSLANMDYTPVKFMIKCFEAHYPESLGVCLIHKAPWLFSSIWSIIKGWLDPVVAAKINFTKTSDDLAKFIPKSQIIKELGGDEDWAYAYVEPSPDEDVALKDTAALEKLEQEREKIVEEYEHLTRMWIKAKEDAESDRIKEERNGISGKLEKGYWNMDKYLRGRTIYDRTGVLKEDGGIEFYPERKKEMAALSNGEKN